MSKNLQMALAYAITMAIISAILNIIGLSGAQDFVLQQQKQRLLKEDLLLLNSIEKQINSNRQMGPKTTYNLIKTYRETIQTIAAKKDSLDRLRMEGKGDFFERAFGNGIIAELGRIFAAFVPVIALFLAIRSQVYVKMSVPKEQRTWITRSTGLVVLGGILFSAIANSVSILSMWGDPNNDFAKFIIFLVGTLISLSEALTYEMFHRVSLAETQLQEQQNQTTNRNLNTYPLPQLQPQPTPPPQAPAAPAVVDNAKQADFFDGFDGEDLID